MRRQLDSQEIGYENFRLNVKTKNDNRTNSSILIMNISENILIKQITYNVAFFSVRNDMLVTGWTTAKNRSNDIKTNV